MTKRWKASDIAQGRGNYCGWPCYSEARRIQGGGIFWSHVQRGAADECWPWAGAAHHQGYGRTRWRGHHVNASRAAWMWTYGEIPSAQLVCHRCDNPVCCNPSHLFLETNAGNQRDKALKGRAKGARPDGANHVRVGSRWLPRVEPDVQRTVHTVRVKGFRIDVAQQLIVQYDLPSGNVSSCPLQDFLASFHEAA